MKKLITRTLAIVAAAAVAVALYRIITVEGPDR
ncbi:MAG: hypothetical protein BMS9Abin07_2147 [Acidimicrobiia bacterium]|nr:MAG: hypothetical protein BMS9Abin07_2147 [Acidimicrobiia bacterium]